MKKGQVSAFTILGIVVAAVILLSLLLQATQRQGASKKETIPAELQPVRAYTQSCLENTAKIAAFFTGARAGYTLLPPTTKTVNNIPLVPLSSIPPQELLEQQLALFIDQQLPRCTDFSRFQQMKVTPQPPTTRVVIRAHDIVLATTYPLAVQVGQQTLKTTAPYETTLPITMSNTLNAVAAILTQQDIDLILLLNTNLDVKISKQENLIVYALEDKSSLVHDLPYTFIFGVEA